MAKRKTATKSKPQKKSRDPDRLPPKFRNYQPPQDGPTDRQPGDPTPEEILEACWLIQQDWSPRERESRRATKRGIGASVFDSDDSDGVQVHQVRERDIVAAARR